MAIVLLACNDIPVLYACWVGDRGNIKSNYKKRDETHRLQLLMQHRTGELFAPRKIMRDNI